MTMIQYLQWQNKSSIFRRKSSGVEPAAVVKNHKVLLELFANGNLVQIVLLQCFLFCDCINLQFVHVASTYKDVFEFTCAVY